MQLPNVSTPVAKCEELSLFATSMFLKFPENAALKALGPKLEAATRALSAAQQAYEGAGAALISARVAIRHADLLADQGVRLTLKAAEIADGKPGGRIASQLFPSGATPIVKPVGATEVAELRNLEGRLSALKESWPGAAAEATKLAELRSRYEAALESRRVALQAQSNSGAVRAAAREDFLDVYAAVTARVKAEFPRDRAMQELFFERIRVDVPADDEPDAGGEPAPAPAPAPALAVAPSPAS